MKNGVSRLKFYREYRLKLTINYIHYSLTVLGCKNSLILNAESFLQDYLVVCMYWLSVVCFAPGVQN